MTEGGPVYPEDVIPSLRFRYCPMCREELGRGAPFDDGIERVACGARGHSAREEGAAAFPPVADVGGLLSPRRRASRLALEAYLARDG